MTSLIPISTSSFADSSFEHFRLNTSNELILYLTHWTGKPLEIVFKNPKDFTYSCGSFPEQLCEVSTNSELYLESLNEWDELSNISIGKLYHFYDIEDHPFFRVIAESVEVILRD